MLVDSHLFIIKNLQRSAIKRYSCYLNGKILDIGCGTKPYKNYLCGYSEYIGMDNNKDVKPDVAGDIKELPFSDGYFDGVLCTEILEHLSLPEIGVKQINRVLKTGGYLYLTVPQEWCLHYEPDDYFRFTKYGIRYLLENNGFEILAIERLGGVFSLTGQRLVDVSWTAMAGLLKGILVLKWAERVAAILCLPASVAFYLLGKIGDCIDKRDAIGWAVLARKQ